MGSLIELNRKRVFSLAEARDVLPVIRKLTEDVNARLKHFLSSLEAVRGTNPERFKEIEDNINKLIAEWQAKVSKLGAEGKGLWLVDFDCGTGFFCWKFPEKELQHFHSYNEGFPARIKMDDEAAI